LAILAAAGGMAMSNGKKLIDHIPPDVRDYLTAGDGLAKASVVEAHPNVKQTLKAPATRAAIVAYLGSHEPWNDPPDLTINALSYLQNGASAKEAEIIEPLLEHPNAWVRLRVYEYLMAIYYPAHDQSAMVNLFQRMLADPDEIVRVQAARWIKGLNLAGDMKGVLQQWTTLAVERKWDREESFTIIQSLLGQR
jgi:hypothetical protein